MRPSGLKVAGVLLLGILAISFGSILVRLALAASGDRSLAFSLVMSAGRMGFAALLLLPGFKNPIRARGGIPFALAAGAALALHFAFWITSLSYTSVAASTALVTTNPVWVTLLGWLLFGERPSGLTHLGVGVALVGGLLIGLGDAQGGGTNPFWGTSWPSSGPWPPPFTSSWGGRPRGGAFPSGIREGGLHHRLPDPLSSPLPLRGEGTGGTRGRSTSASSSWPFCPSLWATPASTGPPATFPGPGDPGRPL
jgi:uncharacterized membrane protein